MTSTPARVTTEVSKETRSMRQRVMELQQQIIDELEPVEFPVKHHFAQGMYAREMFIPAGHVVVGKIHRCEHISVMSAGKLKIVDGSEGHRVISAPYTCISPPGTKRAVYALEDTVWTTFHATDETDLEKIEKQFIAESFEELDAPPEEQQCLGDM